MQTQSPVVVNRRALDVEDYIDIVRRHRTWILGPMFAGLVAAVVIAFLWPDTYISSASIRIVPPQIPESLVPTNINLDMQGRVNAMAQVILSRATLTNIITTMQLYPKERSRMPLDDVIEKMRSEDIKIGTVEDNQVSGRAPATVFQVSFAYPNRIMAQRVCEELVSRFITENVKNSSQESVSTTQFLSDQWALAKKRLDDVEQKLSDFRTRNLGRLPDEMQQNMQELNSLQLQLTNVDTAISRVTQDKLLLENQLRIYKDQLAALESPAGQNAVAPRKSAQLADKDREISGLEDALTQLRQRYKETYPDVQRVEGLLATAKKQRETLVEEEKPAGAEKPPVDPQRAREARDLDANIRRVQAEIEAKNIEMQERQREMARVNASIKTYQSRIEGVPIGEKEYSELMQDRDLARKIYEDLDRRMSASRMATAVENRKQGESLELLDSASLPQTPSEPKRSVIIAIGTACGLLAGLLMAGAREVKDTSLKNLKDVRAYTQLPVLGSIPLLENDLVVRRRRRVAWFAWSMACLIGIVIMSSSVAYYYATRA